MYLHTQGLKIKVSIYTLEITEFPSYSVSAITETTDRISDQHARARFPKKSKWRTVASRYQNTIIKTKLRDR